MSGDESSDMQEHGSRRSERSTSPSPSPSPVPRWSAFLEQRGGHQVADADSGGGAPRGLSDQLVLLVRALTEAHERTLGLLAPRIDTAHRLETEVQVLRRENCHLRDLVKGAELGPPGRPHRHHSGSEEALSPRDHPMQSRGRGCGVEQIRPPHHALLPSQPMPPVSTPPTLMTAPELPQYVSTGTDAADQPSPASIGHSHSGVSSIRGSYTASGGPRGSGGVSFNSDVDTDNVSEDSAMFGGAHNQSGMCKLNSMPLPRSQARWDTDPCEQNKQRSRSVDVELSSEHGIVPCPSNQPLPNKPLTLFYTSDSVGSNGTTGGTAGVDLVLASSGGAASRSPRTSSLAASHSSGARNSRMTPSVSFCVSQPSLGGASSCGDGDEEPQDQDGGTLRQRYPRKKKARRESVRSTYSEALKECVFPHAEALKERVRMTVCTREKVVSELYHVSGCWRAVATSPRFEQVTTFVIACNAIWIAVETELNDETLLTKSPMMFQLMEHVFCAYFFFEWLVRFMAFQKKRDCVLDRWFIFDSLLVALMILETWVMTIFIALTTEGLDGVGNASILRLVRLVRLLRMARMAKLVRFMPELMILIKGMAVATRTVFYTLFLLMIIVFVFSVAFMQLTKGTPMQDMYFKSVFGTMATLLMEGILPDQAVFMRQMANEHIFLAAALLLFILLGSLTVMNMLVGVLVEVVKNTSAIEREQMDVNFLKNHLLAYITAHDANQDCQISKTEFETMLEHQEPLKALQNIGVDVVGLVDFADYIFGREDAISFHDFMDRVLQLRGTNTTTVRDIVNLRKYLMLEMRKLGRLVRQRDSSSQSSLHHK